MRQIRAFIILMLCAIQSFGQIDSLHVYFETEPGPNANQVDVKVNVNNWESLVTVNLFVLWDSTVIEAVQVPFVETNLLVGPTVVLPSQVASLDSGEANFNFFDFSAPTLPDSTHIFTLRFDIIGNPCDQTTLTIGDIGPGSSEMIEVTAVDGNNQLISGVGANSNDLTYMIPGTNCNAAPPLNFAFGQQTVNSGDNVCIPLTVMQFDSIDSFGGSVNWDSQILQYTGVQNFGISNFSETDFNNINPGQLTFAWADLTANNPETLSSGATLFEVCFDVIGGAGTSSSLAITDTPNMISASMAGPTPSSPSISLPFTVTNGSVFIPAAPVPDPVFFSFGSISGATGDNVCLPLSVTDFNNITAVGGSVTWDDTVLQFTGVDGFGFSSLSASNFNANSSNLSFNWMNPVISETLPDGATLFEVCFDIIGGAGASSTVGLSNVPTQIFVTQAGPNPGDPSTPIGFNLSNGVISVPGIVMPDPITFTFPTITAANGDNVCVPLTVANFMSIVSANGSVAWDPTVISYTGAQNFGLAGLSSSLNEGSAPSGSLTFVWSDMTPGTPENLADGDTFMELCFDVIGAGGSSTTINVTDVPTTINIGFQDADPTLPVVNIGATVNNGALTVSGGGGTGMGGEGEAVVFTFPSINAVQGTNVCVPLTVDFFIDIVSATGSINWDPTILSFTGTQNFGVAGLNTAINTGPASTGTITYGWFDNTPASAETIANGDTFMEICFDVIGCDNETSTLNITNNPTDISVGYGPDPALPTMNIDAIINSGSVSTSGDCGGGPMGGVGEAIVYTFPNINADAGTNVCVPLEVDFFEDIVSATGTIMWDPTVLSYTGAQNFGVAGLNTALNTSPAPNGMITFAWFDNTPVSAETIANGGTFMELCFDVVGAGGSTSTLKVTNSPTDISVGYGPDPAAPTENLDAILVDGSVTVGGTQPPPDSVVIFTIPDLCFGPGQEVCFPMTVQNFERISQVDFSLEWDPSVMNFIGVDNAVLSGFNPQGSINSMNIDQGFLTFSWFDGTAVNPNTFDDGTSIIEFCFEVVGELGEVSSLNMTNTPTPIVVSQASTDPTVPGMEVPTFQNNGSLNVKVPDQTFTVSIVCEPTDESIACVDFVVDGFNDLVVTEWNWTWNPDQLCFREITNIHPNATALSEIDFGFFGNDRMNIAWTGTNSPTTIPNGDTYFTICYDVKACPTLAPINIVDPPTSSINFFVTNESDPDNPLPTASNSCILDIDCPNPGAGPSIINEVVVNASSCANTGSISVSFQGGTPPYMCQLSGFAAQSCTSPAISENLAAGTYNLTITDSAGVPVMGGPYVVGADAPIVINPTVVNLTCTSTTGSITINATGGTPPYQFSGPNGPVQTHTGLAEGTYRIEVRDAAGCAQDLFVNVGDDCIGTDPLMHSVTAQNGMCGQGGSIITTATGGVPPYQIFYSPAIQSTGNVPTNVTYTVTCRDAVGTEVSRQVFVGETAPPPLSLSVQNTTAPPDCTPGLGGTADIILSGGCDPVFCEVRQVINGQCTGVINGLTCNSTVTLLPGDYKVTAIPAFGQEVVRNFTIPAAVAPSPLDLLPPTIITDAGPCFGNNATVQLDATGGCGALSLSMLNTLTLATTSPIVGSPFSVEPGMYEITVTDANGDTSVEQLNVTGPTEPIVLTAMGDTCIAGILAEGGVGPYTYEWTNVAMEVVSNDPVFETGVDIDEIYTVVVTDNLGCTAIQTQAVICPADTMAECEFPGEIVFSSLTGGSASCAGTTDCDGTVSGVIDQDCHTLGGSPYTVAAINSIAEQVEIILEEPGPWAISGLCEEEYTIKVTDSQGNCFFPGVNLAVEAPEQIIVTLDSRVCSCPGENEGSFNVTVSGGPDNGGYRVNWTDVNGDALPCIFDCDSLEVGTYFVEVEDDNGCVVTDLIDIEECDPSDCGGPLPDCVGDPVMTPNGDGLNDIFAIDCLPNNNNNELHIYDRWGRLVHTATSYQNDWGGLDLDGQELLEGAYHWVLIQDNEDGVRTVTKGTVTLLNSRP